MNEQKLDELLGRMLQDLGGAFSVPLVQIGDKLGIYKMLSEQGPCTVERLASLTNISERYMREWLSAQAASHYVNYDPTNETFSMSPEQAMVLADSSSPVFMAPAFTSAAVFQQNELQVSEAFKTGEGVAWGDQSECLSCAVARFFRAGYENHLIQAWLPALPGIVEKLEEGARVIDVGCGHGLTTTMMAKAFPNSEVIGLDFHEPSIEAARSHARDQQIDNVSFEAKMATELSGSFDLATLFDCLHDMGDPAGAMRQIRQSLSENGVCMIVEPMAGDKLQDNINPVGRMYYNASTMVCVPTSLAQEKGAALGAQAGPERLRNVIVNEAGFKSVEQVFETPFNMVLAAHR